MRANNRKNEHILISSSLSSLVTAVLVNPIDIVKIRQQKIQEVKSCYQCGPKPSKERRYSLLKSNRSFKFFSSYANCACVPNKSIIKTLHHIIKYEGASTLFNGARYAAMIGCSSTVSFFFFYENTKRIITTNITSNMFYAPILSSLTARTLATTLTFPLDYWRTIQNSMKGYTKKKNFELGNRLFSAYFVTLNRDILFSVVYWSLVENIRRISQIFYGKDNIFLANLIAGSISGGVAAAVSLPLDVVKTRKQLYVDHANTSTLNYLIKLYIEGNQKQLLAGLKPRVIKTTIHCSCLLTGYEYLINLFQKNDYSLYNH